MSYLVLARKYRPMVFEDIVAQDHVSKTLQNAIRNDRVGSGYLFCGPRGTGKTTTARVLAKALNCVEGPTPTPCGKCPICLEITAGSSLDVLEIDAASNTGVDDIRALRENVRYMPTGGKRRVYIIDEIHRLSGQAFDALLKTLEEPPPHVIFIFATTEPLKVPDTILSRTQRYDFKRVSPLDLTNHLKKITALEKMNVEEGALRILARRADGSIRDSLSLLDQVAAFAGENVSEEDVVAALGLVDSELLFEFTEALAAQDAKKALQLIQRIFEAGIDGSDFVAEIMEHFRTLLVLRTDPDTATALGRTDEELGRLHKQASHFSPGDIIRLMKMGSDLHYDLKSGLDERLVLEMSAVKMAEMETTIKFEEVLAHLQQVQPPGDANDLFGSTQKKKNSPAIGPTSTTAGFSKSEASATAPPPSKSYNQPVIESGWEKFLSSLRQRSQMLSSLLSMGEIEEVADNEIIMVFATADEASKQVLEKSENFNLIVQGLREHFGAGLSIKFRIDANRTSAGSTDDNGALSKEEVNQLVENSPRLRKLVEKVNGEVLGVRKIK